MKKLLVALYSLGSYALLLATSLATIEFLGRDIVPGALNTRGATAILPALLIDTALLVLVGVQHSVMARPRFTHAWARLVPSPVERSTYVLLSSAALLLLIWQWRPMPAPIWSVEPLASELIIEGAFWFGVGMTLSATFQIDHFRLFGLRQAWDYLRDRQPATPAFTLPSPYRLVRHPLMLGLLITYWATPQLTAGQLLFAGGMTIYILIGLAFEERDLLRTVGAYYRARQAEIPQRIPGFPPAMPRHAAASGASVSVDGTAD